MFNDKKQSKFDTYILPLKIMRSTETPYVLDYANIANLIINKLMVSVVKSKFLRVRVIVHNGKSLNSSHARRKVNVMV